MRITDRGPFGGAVMIYSTLQLVSLLEEVVTLDLKIPLALAIMCLIKYSFQIFV